MLKANLHFLFSFYRVYTFLVLLISCNIAFSKNECLYIFDDTAFLFKHDIQLTGWSASQKKLIDKVRQSTDLDSLSDALLNLVQEIETTIYVPKRMRGVYSGGPYVKENDHLPTPTQLVAAIVHHLNPESPLINVNTGRSFTALESFLLSVYNKETNVVIDIDKSLSLLAETIESLSLNGKS